MSMDRLSDLNFDLTRRGLFATGHLRYAPIWLTLGCALVLTVVMLSVIDVPQPVHEIMLNDKLAHLCVYAGLMGWFAQLFRNDLMRLVLVFGFVVLGIGVEFLQSLTSTRQFEVLDMIANASGVLLAWALSYTWVGEVMPYVERRLRRMPVSAAPR